jgi:DNA invertase Pin-like site-specific DNA recombinase
LERESNLAAAEDAIKTQHHALVAEVTRHGHVVVRVVTAPGYSGELPATERPDFEEILDAAERHEFDYVLATEIARVNRGEAWTYYYLKHQLESLGVRLEFLDQQFTDDGESETGALLEGLSVLLPSAEKRNIRRRLKRAKTRVREEGFQWTGVSPFGFEYVKGGQKRHLWRIVPEEADLLAGTAEDGAAAAPEKPRAVAEAREPYGTAEPVERFPRQYLPGCRAALWRRRKQR